MGKATQIFAIAGKDLRHLLRDPAAAFFVLIFPIFVALLFGTIFGGGGGGSDSLDVGVFNEDMGVASAAFVRSLDEDDAIKVVTVATMDEGMGKVRLGEIVACLRLRPGFDPQQIFGQGITIEGVLDPKRAAEAGLLEGKLNQLAFQQMSSMVTDPAASRRMMENARKSVIEGDAPAGIKLSLGLLFGAVDAVSSEVEKDQKAAAASGSTAKKESFAWQPVRVNLEKLSINRTGPPSSFAMSFPQGMVWGLMGVVTGFAAGFAAERTRGTLTRLNVAPVPPAVILAGKALACFLSCLIVQALLLALAALPFFNVTFGSPAMIVLVCVVTAASLSGLAMFIAGLSKSEESAGGLARAALIVLALIGGGSIPLMFMPSFMRTLSGISPFKWSTQAIEGAMWRGFTLAELALPLGILAGIGIVGFAIGAAAISRSARA